MTVAKAGYTSKIIKAGALLPDTKLLLTHWESACDVQTNLRRIHEQNLLGKTSRARLASILAIFKQRYLSDPQVLRALVTLAQAPVSAATLDPILYFLATQADPLLRDVVTQVLAPLVSRGQLEVRVADVEQWLREQIAAGNMQGVWSADTTNRAARSILATLRDFKLLSGQVKKRFAAHYLSPTAFAFIAYMLNRTQRSGDRLLHEPAWEVFFLVPQAVERLFLEADQAQLLSYHAAGRIIRIDFPYPTLEEYANALARRAA
jgi:hypothetical protein